MDPRQKENTMKMLKTARFARIQAKWLALVMAVCALAVPLAPAAHAQFPIPPITVPGFGTLLLVPMPLLGPILSLNQQTNISQIGNVQIGSSNFALIQVQQGNLAVPASAVPALVNLNVQTNISVVNNVQVGNNNVAIISVSQGNVH
jgi:hypothetical protein